ncbi:MAG: aromatic acid/H+ symport family MFS transporter [Flavobacteriaceae bacterium]|jgi:benzoate transport|nr:aromatic acid/H+ symport family MFS transporter [Flavobacteriaceae bacterium]
MFQYFSQDIDQIKISKVQYFSIAICFLMNVLDGMDVLVVSYCAPAIAQALKLGPKTLGIVFSAGLVGMAIGAIFLAPYADKFGRKKLILASAFIMGFSVLLTALSENILQLVIMRLISGLGIGCMLATTATLTSENVLNNSKDFWVSLVISGYPVGAVISGYIAATVIPSYGWESMFIFAGLTTLLTIPLTYFFLTESPQFYLKKQPFGALEKVNKLFIKMNLRPLDNLPEFRLNLKNKPLVSQLFSNKYKLSTLQLWAALFFAFGCLYFLISWIPKLATDAGLSIELAIYAGTIFNVGAFFGIVLQGYFSSKIGLKKTISIFLLLTFVLMASFKVFIGTDFLLIVYFLLGFSLQGGFVGLYAVAARLYPTEFKTTGVGWAIGVGRLGGILAPVIGGLFIAMGLSLSANFLIFSIPALFASILTYYISSKDIT